MENVVSPTPKPARSEAQNEWCRLEREKAIAKYMENPNVCKACGKVILVAEHQQVWAVRTKTVCNHVCATKFKWLDKEKALTEHNRNFNKNYGKLGSAISNKLQHERALQNYIAQDVRCLYCDKEIPPPENTSYYRSLAAAANRNFCSYACTQKYSWEVAKRESGLPATSEELGKCRKDEVKLHQIRSNAKYILRNNKEMKCQDCGSIEGIDTCHIKPVSKFTKDSLVSEINHIDNLIPLCKLCHWKFDHAGENPRVKLGGYKGNRYHKRKEPTS